MSDTINILIQQNVEQIRISAIESSKEVSVSVIENNEQVTIKTDLLGVKQIQSDWNQTDNTQVDFIKNKPSISANLGVLVITADGGAVYQSNDLIGVNVLLVTNDNVVRIPSDYSFNTTTGTITFISTIDVDVIIQILYV